MMLKSFSRIQVKIYGCSVGDTIFPAAQLVSCNELHSPLTLFDQAYSVTQLWLVMVGSAPPTPLHLNQMVQTAAFSQICMSHPWMWQALYCHVLLWSLWKSHSFNRLCNRNYL